MSQQKNEALHFSWNILTNFVDKLYLPKIFSVRAGNMQNIDKLYKIWTRKRWKRNNRH